MYLWDGAGAPRGNLQSGAAVFHNFHRSHFKTFFVILNEVKDLKSLKMRDSSLRSE
jgi:hypothetical protein